MTTSGSGTSFVQHRLDEGYDTFQISVDKSVAQTAKQAKAIAAKYAAELGNFSDAGESFVFAQRPPEAFVPGTDDDRTSEPEAGVRILYKKLALKPADMKMLEGKKFGAKKLEKLTKKLKREPGVDNPYALAKAIQKGTVNREGDESVKTINEQAAAVNTNDLEKVKDEASKSSRRDPREPAVPGNLPADQKGIDPDVDSDADTQALSKSNQLTASAYESSMKAQTTGKHPEAAEAHRKAASAAREAGLLERALRHQEQAEAHDNFGKPSKETKEMEQNWVTKLYPDWKPEKLAEAEEDDEEEKEESVKETDDDDEDDASGDVDPYEKPSDSDDADEDDEENGEEESELDVNATAARANQLAADAKEGKHFEEAGDVALKLARHLGKKGMKEEAGKWFGASQSHKAKAFEMGYHG